MQCSPACMVSGGVADGSVHCIATWCGATPRERMHNSSGNQTSSRMLKLATMRQNEISLHLLNTSIRQRKRTNALTHARIPVRGIAFRNLDWCFRNRTKHPGGCFTAKAWKRDDIIELEFRLTRVFGL